MFECLFFFVFLGICLFVCLCICIFVFLLEITSVVREIVDGPDGGVEKGDDEDGKESQFEHNLLNNAPFAGNIIFNTC